MPSHRAITPPQGAIAGVGLACGVGLRSAQHAARLLREKANLWPTIGSGRRELVSIPDVVNLTIALACAFGHPSDGPRVVSEFRSLVKKRITRTVFEGDTFKRTAVDLEVRPLGEWLDAWVDSLVNVGEQQEPLHPLDDARRQQPIIRIKLTSPMTAEVMLVSDDDSGNNEFIHYGTDKDFPELDAVEPSKLSRVEVLIGIQEMEALAAILRAAYVPDLLSGPGSSSKEDGENGASPNIKKAATGANPSGLLKHPASQTQATPRDLAMIEDSLPEQEGRKQPLPPLSGSGSRVRHRSAVRRHAEPTTRKTNNGTDRSAAAPP